MNKAIVIATGAAVVVAASIAGWLHFGGESVEAFAVSTLRKTLRFDPESAKFQAVSSINKGEITCVLGEVVAKNSHGTFLRPLAFVVVVKKVPNSPVAALEREINQYGDEKKFEAVKAKYCN